MGDDTFNCDVHLLDDDDCDVSTHSMFSSLPKWPIATIADAVDFLVGPST
jgi:hypothetical protein